MAKKSAGVRTMKKEFHNAVKSRFESVVTNDNYVVATSVEPRFKTAFTAEKGRKLLLREVGKFFFTPVDVRTNSSVVEKKQVDLLDCFDELVASSINTISQTSFDNNPGEKEVSTFLAVPLVAKDECPFKWWATQKSAFPNIYKVTKKF